MKAIVISEENSTIELFKKYFEEFGKIEFLSGTSDFAKAYDAVKELVQAVVVVDLSGYQEQALNFVSKVTSECPQVRVITLSDKPDADLVIRAMRVGASDFISVPVIKSDLFEVLEKLFNDMTGKPFKKSKCRVVTVYSNKGGVGKTSVAVNLAYELAGITKENVALVDLNFELGDVTTFLDLKPTYNISYMFQNIDKINGEFLLSAMERYKESSLYILADSPYFRQAENISTDKISKLFDILRDSFSYVIVDTSGGFDKRALTVLKNSDMVLFTLIVNLPAIRNCQRCLEFFDKTGLENEKIKILVNRYMENDEISAKDVEEVLKKNIYGKIPNNYFTMMSAINKGVPVPCVNPDSNVALSYKNLALTVADSIRENND